jgi:hypothetical protein
MTDQSQVAGLAPIRAMDARAGLPANRTKCLHLDRCHGQNNHRVVNCSLIEMQPCRIGQNDGGEFAFDVFGNRLAVCWHANKHSGMGLPPLSRELRENRKLSPLHHRIWAHWRVDGRYRHHRKRAHFIMGGLMLPVVGSCERCSRGARIAEEPLAAAVVVGAVGKWITASTSAVIHLPISPLGWLAGEHPFAGAGGTGTTPRSVPECGPFVSADRAAPRSGVPGRRPGSSLRT